MAPPTPSTIEVDREALKELIEWLLGPNASSLPPSGNNACSSCLTISATSTVLPQNMGAAVTTWTTYDPVTSDPVTSDPVTALSSSLTSLPSPATASARLSNVTHTSQTSTSVTSTSQILTAITPKSQTLTSITSTSSVADPTSLDLSHTSSFSLPSSSSTTEEQFNAPPVANVASSEATSKSGINIGIIIGVTIASLAALILLGVLLFCLLRRKRRKRQAEQEFQGYISGPIGEAQSSQDVSPSYYERDWEKRASSFQQRGLSDYEAQLENRTIYNAPTPTILSPPPIHMDENPNLHSAGAQEMGLRQDIEPRYPESVLDYYSPGQDTGLGRANTRLTRSNTMWSTASGDTSLPYDRPAVPPLPSLPEDTDTHEERYDQDTEMERSTLEYYDNRMRDINITPPHSPPFTDPANTAPLNLRWNKETHRDSFRSDMLPAVNEADTARLTGNEVPQSSKWLPSLPTFLQR